MTAARMGKGDAKASAVTPWFGVRQVPAYKGVYSTRTPGKPHSAGYQYWNGCYWCAFNFTHLDAFRERGLKSIYQDNEWRGLASDPNGVAE